MNCKIAFVANTGFALYGFRLNLMKFLVDLGYDVVALANDEANFASKLTSYGIRFIDTCVDHKGMNPFSDILYSLKLKRIYEVEKPVLVHHFTIKPVVYGSLAARLAKVPAIVNTITGLGYSFDKGGWLQKLVELLYRLALTGRTKTIFQNNDNQRLFVAKGLVSKDQTQVILGSGISTREIYPKKQPKKDHFKTTFLLIGRMLWSKGIKEFVSAAGHVKRLYPGCEFIMAGGFSGGGAAANPEKIPLKWLHDTNRKGTVRWVGHVPYREIMKLLDDASVVVLPSYAEGVPKTLIEAAAKAKPIIATDAPGCREVVVGGLNGFLVPVKDSISLAESMMNFINSPELFSKMGAESRKRAVALFDERIVFEQTMDVYRRAYARQGIF
jgi:glycosyltransferase involved in cell wall biosynthesis